MAILIAALASMAGAIGGYIASDIYKWIKRKIFGIKEKNEKIRKWYFWKYKYPYTKEK